MANDPRYVIDYGKYVGPGTNKNSIGGWVAYLAVFAGLQEADYGQATGDGGYRLHGGVIAKLRGTFDHDIFGWVPVFDFEMPPDHLVNKYNFDYIKNKIDSCEYNQTEFLKKLVLGEFKKLPE